VILTTECNITLLPCAYCNPVCEHRITGEIVRYHDVYGSGCNLYRYRKDDYMEEKKFMCEYCGKEYDTPVDRGDCELSCYQRAIAEEEKAKKEKLAKDKEERKKKILHLRQELIELEKMYYRDFGEWVETLREPLVRTVTVDGDWGKYFEDVLGRIRW